MKLLSGTEFRVMMPSKVQTGINFYTCVLCHGIDEDNVDDDDDDDKYNDGDNDDDDDKYNDEDDNDHDDNN